MIEEKSRKKKTGKWDGDEEEWRKNIERNERNRKRKENKNKETKRRGKNKEIKIKD